MSIAGANSVLSGGNGHGRFGPVNGNGCYRTGLQPAAALGIGRPYLDYAIYAIGDIGGDDFIVISHYPIAAGRSNAIEAPADGKLILIICNRAITKGRAFKRISILHIAKADRNIYNLATGNRDWKLTGYL